jgi:hypothetical protein
MVATDDAIEQVMRGGLSADGVPSSSDGVDARGPLFGILYEGGQQLRRRRKAVDFDLGSLDAGGSGAA